MHGRRHEVRHAEMLGFFAGVLALILSGVQIALETRKDEAEGRGGAGGEAAAAFDPDPIMAAVDLVGVLGGFGPAQAVAGPDPTASAGLVLLMLGGVLLMVFGGLGALLRSRPRDMLSALIPAALGALMFTAAFLARSALEDSPFPRFVAERTAALWR